MEARNGEYELTDDPRRVDLDRVCELLADSYWAGDRPRRLHAVAIENSLCFSVHHRGRMVALARVISDFGTSSYLTDVVVDPAHRGKGIGRWLVARVLEHPAVAETRTLLVTRDAQALYRGLGFVTHPYECMVRRPEETQRAEEK